MNEAMHPLLDRRNFLRIAGLASTAIFAGPILALQRQNGGFDVGASHLGRPFKIGALLAVSDAYPALGNNLIAGMRLFFDKVSASESGAEIQLVTESVGQGVSPAIQKSLKLIQQDNVDVVVGALSSEVAARLRHLFQENRIPLIVSNVGANVVREADQNPYVIYNSLNYWQANWAMGAWAGQNLGPRGFVATSLYDSGYDALYAFRQGFESAGGEIIRTAVTHAAPGTGDLSVLFREIGAAKPDFVHALYYGKLAAGFLSAFARSGLSGQIPLTGSGFLVEDDVLAAQGRAALGIKSALSWTSGLATAENQAFTSAFQNATGNAPDVFAVLGFDAAQLVHKLFSAIGTELLQGDEWLDALGGIKFDSPRGTLKLDPRTRSVISPLYLREVGVHALKPANIVIDTLDPVPEARAGGQLEKASPKTGWLNAYLSV